MKIHATRHLLLATLGLTVALTLGACGKPPAPAADAPAPVETPPPVDVPVEAPAAPATADGALPLPRSESPAGARVEILSPKDGAKVSSPVKVVFGLEGMVLAPAGDPAPNSGHHHLLVDTAAPDLGLPLPKDAQHLHFGQAQTEAEITLPPGQHTLQLVLGDTNHVPHNPPVISAPISITVQ